MAQFSYTAKSRDGETRTGTVDAADRRAALAAVSRLGLLPVRVEAGAAAGGAKALPSGKAVIKDAAEKLQSSASVATDELMDILAAGLKSLKAGWNEVKKTYGDERKDK